MSAITAGYAQNSIISKTIRMSINGTEVEGYFEASLYNIKTTITKPFRHISQSWHIPYFAKGQMNYHSQYGKQRAQESLKNIYWVAEYIHRKKDMLKRKHQEFEEKISEMSEGRINASDFKLKRQAMRVQLRNGDISNRAYQRRIRSMLCEVEALEKRIWELEEAFFEAYFPMSLSVSIRESVIGILNGRKKSLD